MLVHGLKRGRHTHNKQHDHAIVVFFPAIQGQANISDKIKQSYPTYLMGHSLSSSMIGWYAHRSINGACFVWCHQLMTNNKSVACYRCQLLPFGQHRDIACMIDRYGAIIWKRLCVYTPLKPSGLYVYAHMYPVWYSAKPFLIFTNAKLFRTKCGAAYRTPTIQVYCYMAPYWNKNNNIPGNFVV